jgi:hypothetical protein
MHEPNRLWPWVFLQHQVWVDINGSEHEIEWMSFDYARNVIVFCRRRAVWIYALVMEDELFDDPLEGEPNAKLDNPLSVDVAAWLEATPLMRALTRRLDRASK